MKDLSDIIYQIQSFQTDSLKSKISSMEKSFSGADAEKSAMLLKDTQINEDLIKGALQIKKVAGQINVTIHTLGILISLPYVLKNGEIVEFLSLGAGNTGRKFDLETNLRVAEYKFISWKGGSETIRQNQLFKDFYKLAECNSRKEKYLYVVGVDIPLRFLSGHRALASVMSRNNKLWNSFKIKYGERFNVVNEYYEYKKHEVKIIDLDKIVPMFENISPVGEL